jgi:hypothetical protein
MEKLNKNNNKQETISLPKDPSGITAIPKYDNDKYTELIRNSGLIRRNADKEYQISYNMRHSFDSISIWWRDQENISNELCKLKHFTESPLIPELERTEVSDHYYDSFEYANNANININQMYKIYSDEYKESLLKKFWSSIDEDKKLVQETGLSIQNYNEKELIKTILFSVCEAIHESEEMTPEIIRQKIAQYAWTKLVTLIPYAIAHDKRIPIIGDKEKEKSEIEKALKKNLWDDNEKENNNQKFEELLKQVKSSKNERLSTNFQVFYHLTQNSSIKSSAFDIFLLQKKVWEQLYEEDAFYRE